MNLALLVCTTRVTNPSLFPGFRHVSVCPPISFTPQRHRGTEKVKEDLGELVLRLSLCLCTTIMQFLVFLCKFSTLDSRLSTLVAALPRCASVLKNNIFIKPQRHRDTE